MTTPYNAFPNRFRQRLLAGERMIGCWLSLGSPIATEVVGVAGFDWLLLDAEHAPNDVLSLIPQLMALKDSSSAPVVRPAWNDTVEIKRLLDAGCHNFLIPFVETAERARAAVAATRYPPQGVRGVSVSQRSNRYGTVSDYFKVVNDNIALIVQIESRAGVAGFDWLLLDAEHAPNDVLTLIPQLMALKDSASAPVVRPSWNHPVELKRLLDAGFYNFLIPFIESADEARRAVAATRYPPQGVRGVSVAQRSNRFGSVAGYFEGINEQICVMVQIEGRRGVAAAAEIAAVDGVDCLFIGPSDLAAAYGHLGNPNHPEVQAAIATVFEAARAASKPAGILSPAEADARRYLALGMRLVAVGSDLGVLRMSTQALCDKYRDDAPPPIAAQY